jgi:carbamoyltransferase
MLVLGFHGGIKREDEDNPEGFSYHDSAAVLVRDGEILSAIEEERLNRIKHTNCFPLRAIQYCLSEHKLGMVDIDYLATNSEQVGVDFMTRRRCLDNPNLKLLTDGRQFVASLFERDFGINVANKLRFCRHHLAHAWSAYVTSGYDSSLVLILDGDGDNRSGMVFLAQGNNMSKLQEYSYNQSLGNLYTEIIKLIGYNRFDEYKVMGLAPYGDPEVYAPLFDKCYELLPNGNYALADESVWLVHFGAAGLLDTARRKGEPFTQTHMNIAAGLQAMLEKITLHVVTHFQKETKQRRLCFAGGVAHNCTLNGVLLYSGMFDKMFVQPAAHDAGGALGAALNVFYEEGIPVRKRRLPHLFLGTDVSDNVAAERVLRSWEKFLNIGKVERVTEKTAQLIADGAVVGWVQGRSEFGPRALGNRSILADPRPASNKLLINQMVKKREAYRPFAPSVLEEKLHEFFEVPRNRADYPFMIFVLQVREDKRELLGAITHVDGTARVQTVSVKDNSKYWALIYEFGKLTGVPILLNTSFNNNAEPIVDSVEDAVVCFLTTDLNYLVVGDYLVSKKEHVTLQSAYQTLVPGLPVSRRLAKRRNFATPETPVFQIEGTMSRYFARPTLEILPEVFSVLLASDGRKSLRMLFEEANVPEGEARENAIVQILDLWSQRILILRPETAVPRTCA